MRFLPAALLLMLGCGAPGGKAEGQTCVTSQECGPGLLCNYGVTPHVCAKSSTVERQDLTVPEDMAVPVDLAGADLRGVDMTVVVPPDMTNVTPPDMTQVD